ncbi:DNA-binding protein [Actinoplanes sp. ATCC 53533]|uniref:DNA-binding protein n=1 Tax=Actinoplanes sp. ATCC 53533 TaxID=1288362 RepID=UPI000F7A5F69|nr:DNA-binding protein [Actinoplanes sp. ATCC 53533]RSM73511.1 DNA-binding protein [Actinoplanes sp. ATCC 53533]
MTNTANVSTPELAGVEEILDLLVRISRDRVRELTCRSDFPEPAAELAQGDIWLRDDVETWINDHSDALADMLRQTR